MKFWVINQDLKTDAAGAIQVELPKYTACVRIWAGAKSFVTMFANWEETELAIGKGLHEKGLPGEYTFHLEPGLAAGGRIVDQEGKPIAGVKVQVSMNFDLKPANGDGRVSYDPWLANGSDAAITDADGRWRIKNVPNDPRVELSLLVSHPDYVSDQKWKEAQEAGGVNTAMLLKEKATLTLKRGVIVRGQVTDPAGKPIKDAIIVLGDEPYNSAARRSFRPTRMAAINCPRWRQARRRLQSWPTAGRLNSARSTSRPSCRRRISTWRRARRSACASSMPPASQSPRPTL